MTYASAQGHVFLARDLSVPTAWTHEKPRGEGAGIPAARTLATKPPRAQQRLPRAFDAGVPAAWVTGERVEGENRSRRRWLETQAPAQVLAVSGQAYVWRAGRQHHGKTLRAGLGTEGWCRLSAGAGATGPRWEDWQWLAQAAPRPRDWRRGLLVRRRLRDPPALTAYVVLAPHAPPTLATVVQVAGSRWTVERCVAEAKGEVGVEQDAVRRGTGWYRHRTFALGA